MFTALLSIVRKFHARRPARQRLRRKVPAVPYLPLVLAATGAAMLGARAADAGGMNAPAWRTSFSVSHGDAVGRIAFSRDGRYLAVGSGGKDIRVIETTTGREVARTRIGAAANRIAFSTDGRYCAVAGGDATVRVIETATGKEISKAKELFAAIAWDERSQVGKGSNRPDNGGTVTDVVFTSGRNYVARWFDGQASTTLVIDAATGKQVSRKKDHWAVSMGCVTSDGRYQANACEDSTVRLFEVASGKEVGMASLENETESIIYRGSLVFSPDARYLAVSVGLSRSLGEVLLLEAATAKEFRRLRFEHHITDPVGFSRDGRYLAVKDDKIVQIFETATGRKAGSVEVGEIAGRGPLAFGPDGRYLAAARNKIARVFEVATGREIFKTEFNRDVKSVEFSPDGRYLAANDDTTVRMLDVMPEEKSDFRTASDSCTPAWTIAGIVTLVLGVFVVRRLNKRRNIRFTSAI